MKFTAPSPATTRSSKDRGTMQNRTYQQQSLAGMNPVELIVALYDGMVRFRSQAIAATAAGDIGARRIAVKPVRDILMHPQSRLRMDVGAPAKSLSES